MFNDLYLKLYNSLYISNLNIFFDKTIKNP